MLEEEKSKQSEWSVKVNQDLSNKGASVAGGCVYWGQLGTALFEMVSLGTKASVRHWHYKKQTQHPTQHNTKNCWG